MSQIAASRNNATARIAGAGIALALLVLMPGCGMPLFTATETLYEVFETDDAPTIIVETFNGSIDISDGENDEVVLEIHKRASGFDQRTAEDNLQNIEVSMVQEGNEIRIVARRAHHVPGNYGAEMIIAAPKRAKIKLQSSNSYIVSEGMQGGIDARTSNAKIEVYDGSGPIEADSSNGSIRIEADDAVVGAHTSNARIRFRGTLAEGDHKFDTSNSRIDVTLPEDSQFRFDASTSNGSIDCDFPYEGDRSRRSRRKKSGTVGDNPDFSLTLETSNGSIDIREAD